uniref:Uncharacterized protein n=1 Tax=Eubacterium cellulosolvens (strain ATCC 43171 / JCM 9499 / 6) TaxID=633697 RepID=I5AW80_EUBC6
MAFDYKKEYKEFYMPKGIPSIVNVPKMNFIAVRGSGDPNDEDGEYKQAIGLLYGIAFTIKMSKRGEHQIDRYFDYVVHHEIYLSDARKVAPEKLKTVIRHPINVKG